MSIDFIGKKNVRNICTVKNKRVIRNIKHKHRTLKHKHERLFDISSKQVNDYLKQFGTFSAKNFRTWGANIELISQFNKLCTNNQYSKSEIKKILHRAIQKVAHKLHNTTSVCKSNYLDPELIKFFLTDYKKFILFFSDKQFNKDKLSKNYVLFLETL